MKRRLVFTAVFNGYDKVYPPVVAEDGVDYVIITDDAATTAPGWRTVTVDTARFATAKAANLYHRALIHRVLPGYDASLYVDGNIRLLGPSRALFDALHDHGAAVMLHRHPLRDSVAQEANAVLGSSKIGGSSLCEDELEAYRRDGFPDDVGLAETGIILKNHHHPQLDRAMELWWTLFEKYATRDQLSFPYVIWKTGLDILWISESFRDPNPYFAIYPHWRAKGVNQWYTHVSARSHDSRVYWGLLALWHWQWRMQRVLKKRSVR